MDWVVHSKTEEVQLLEEHVEIVLEVVKEVEGASESNETFAVGDISELEASNKSKSESSGLSGVELDAVVGLSAIAVSCGVSVGGISI